MPSSIPQIKGGVGSVTGVLAAVPQIAGLKTSNDSQTIGYQPQPNTPGNGGNVSQPAANLMNTVNSTINSLFGQAPALLFHYEGEQTVTYEADVTDHFIEDNTNIQDHIALKCVIITTQGFIGELNDVPPNKVLQLLQITANTLGSLGAYAPSLSVTALEAYNEAFQAYQLASNAISAGQSAWNTLNGTSSGESVITSGEITTPVQCQNLQQIMFQQLFSYQNARILFTVQTPWAVFKNCAIIALKAIQDPDTQVITDFSVTFKQMRFVSDLLAIQSVIRNSSGRNATQDTSPVNVGNSSGVPATPTATALLGPSGLT